MIAFLFSFYFFSGQHFLWFFEALFIEEVIYLTPLQNLVWLWQLFLWPMNSVLTHSYYHPKFKLYSVCQSLREIC
jgi:hypothetical protein